MALSSDRLVRLAVGDMAVVVDLDLGARAVSWTVGGHELLAHHGDNAVEHGMYPMAPWAGRLRDNEVAWDGAIHPLPPTYGPWAIHGTILGRPGRVLLDEADTDRARLVARFSDHGAWPWPTSVDVEWQMEPRALTTRLTVHAEAAPFPAVVGWHPWFRRRLEVGDALQWRLSASARLVRGEDHLPTGELAEVDLADGPFDDAFVATDAQVVWPGAYRLDISSDGGWFVVFDELSDAACIEPQSGPPDGLKEQAGQGPRVAAPGHPLVLTNRWVVSDEPPADRA